MNLLDPTLIVLGVIATAIMCSVVALLRGQPRGALWGALVSASPLVPMILLYDVLAAQLGW